MQLNQRIEDYQKAHPAGGDPPFEIPTPTQRKIWACEIETRHAEVAGTGFCRCTHAMYSEGDSHAG